MNNDAELAWAGGLFEARGCITVKVERRPKMGKPRRPLLCFEFGDFDTLNKFSSIIKYGTISGPRNIRGKPRWRWSIAGADSYKVIVKIFPFLCSRQRASALRVFGSVALGVDTEWYPGLELTYRQKGDRIGVLK